MATPTAIKRWARHSFFSDVWARATLLGKVKISGPGIPYVEKARGWNSMPLTSDILMRAPFVGLSHPQRVGWLRGLLLHVRRGQWVHNCDVNQDDLPSQLETDVWPPPIVEPRFVEVRVEPIMDQEVPKRPFDFLMAGGLSFPLHLLAVQCVYAKLLIAEGCTAHALELRLRGRGDQVPEAALLNRGGRW